MNLDDIPYESETETIIYETLEKADSDLSIKEIAEHADMHRNTVYPYVKVLTHTGRIKHTRKVGNAKFYDTK